MKKIAIVTLYGIFNYGNRLQNYALQETLKKLGFDVETLIAVSKNPIVRLAKRFLKKRSRKLFVKRNVDIKREKAFLSFNNHIQFYNVGKHIFGSELNSRYDCFIVGSDQVWNPLFWSITSGSYCREFNDFFLTFVIPEKRIAYAASFGISELPPKWEDKMSRELVNFKAISVRENSGATIVKELTGIDVPVLLDPTMLLTAEEWRKLETHHIAIKEKYILAFFLGEQPLEVYREIQIYAKTIDATILEMTNFKSKYYSLGPDGFLEMIDHAEQVFTDSFHATVFSILFHKPFHIYQRHLDENIDMGSRMETLLQKTKLETKIMENQTLSEEDFLQADKILERERASAMHFLCNAVNMTLTKQ